MAKARKKRKPRQPASTAARPPNFLFSVLFFLTSALIFIHQCVTPFHTLPRLRRLSTLRQHASASASAGERPSPAAPRNWFQTGASPPADAAPAPLSAGDALADIPRGPLPLPVLSAASDTAPASAPAAPAGSSWTGSLAHGVLAALPLHWVAEAAHAPPRKGDASARQGEERDSIFAARRKGAWIGCERPFHLVCKGVYRAIKVTNAVRVVDLECERDRGWLPHILNKLREEFRMVQLTCAVPEQARMEGVRQAYEGVKDAKVVVLDAFKDPFPEGTDMLVAYKVLEERTLIDAMRFFKNVKASGTVRLLATETFPGEGNEPKPAAKRNEAGKLRINTALAPFWFPPPVYEYENAEENPEDVNMQICAVRVDELFREKNTPEMQDLVDPRKRQVQE